MRIPRSLTAAVLAAAAATGAALGSGSAAGHVTAGRTPLTATGFTSPIGATSPTGPATAVNATNRLAVGLLPRLGGGGNVVFSPYSIEAALAMVDQGAAGQTAAQIGQVLGASDPAQLAAANGQLSAELAAAVTAPAGASSTQTAQLDVANGLWLQSGFAVNPSFTATLDQDFGAGLQTVDFNGDPDGARGTINSWVADHTGGLIGNLFPEGTITAQTKLVLANAIYLKALWSSPFASSETAPAPFYPSAGMHVSVPFMHMGPGSVESFPYARARGYVAVALPYASSSLSMLAVMPSPGTLPVFQHKLTGVAIARIVRSLRSQPVTVSMPKLSVDIQTDLSAVLSALGMPLAFSNAADFRNISTQVPLKIQDVQHAAVMKVDEAGTVAAAATGVSFAPTAVAEAPTVLVTLNHPFLLFLRDDRTGAILFAARIMNPLGR